VFKNLFNKRATTDSDIPRVNMTHENQIEELLNLSNQKPILLFKHSTRCGISSMVLKRFENKIKNEESDFGYYFLDLLQHRDLSNAIAQKLEVPHQSPQLIVVKDGKVSKHGSHYAIVDVDI